MVRNIVDTNLTTYLYVDDLEALLLNIFGYEIEVKVGTAYCS